MATKDKQAKQLAKSRKGEVTEAPALPVHTPATDVYHTETGMVLVMDLPGVAEADVDIELDHPSLRIQAEARYEVEAGLRWLHRDLHSRRYLRSFRLGDRVDAGKASARFENGVLTLELPFKAESMPRKIRIG